MTAECNPQGVQSKVCEKGEAVKKPSPLPMTQQKARVYHQGRKINKRIP